MAFNGSGLFQRLYSWVNDAANSINIRADRMDAEMDGLASGLSNCITRDGQGKPSAAIDWNGQNLNNVNAGAFASVTVSTPPAQFDSTAKVPTTAFLKAALGNRSGIIGITGDTTISAANAGCLIANNTTGATITLPAASTLPAGTVFAFVASGSGTLQRSASDTFVVGGNVMTAIALGVGDNLTMVSNASNNTWYAESGSAMLKYSAGFASSGNGNSAVQALPGGLLIQRGTLLCTNANQFYRFTFAEAFTDAGNINVVAMAVNGATGAPFYAWHNSVTAAYVDIACGSAACYVDIIAIGK